MDIWELKEKALKRRVEKSSASSLANTRCDRPLQKYGYLQLI